MSEHPIIFATPMVRAILEGRKTETRRLQCLEARRTIPGDILRAEAFTLRVLDVRAERLQDITEEGAQAEGVSWEPGEQERNIRKWGEPQTARMRFADLWDSINGKRAPWESNPWVWVIRFERVS